MGTTIKKTTAKKTVTPKTGTSKASAPKTAVVKSVAPKTAGKTALKAGGEPVEVKKTARTKPSVAQTVKKTPASARTSSPKTSPEKSEETPLKKPTAKKVALAKPAAKKVVARKTAVKEAGAKKASVKKAQVKKTGTVTKAVKKTAARKTVALKAVSTETASVKPAVKKTAAKKSAVRKSVSTSQKALETPQEPLPVPSESRPKKSAVSKAAPTKTTARNSAKTGKVLDVEKPPVSGANPQMDIESKKFDVGCECEMPYPTPPPGYGLPDFYDETYVRLLVRDPEWVFVYWEIDTQTRERFWIPRGAHQGRLVLRWYDVTDVPEFNGQNAQRVIETAINDQTSSWYQHLPDPGRYWCAELGVLSSEGEFLCICRSNVVQTPRVTLASPRDYERWMRVGWLLEEREIFEAPAGQAPSEAQEAEGSRRARTDKSRPAWQPGAPGEPESGTEEAVARLEGQPLGGRSSEGFLSSFGFVSSSQVMRPDLAEQLETLKKTRKK
ncbi:MAG TPA: DUF4912 domain-containing protein [Candidatus Sumerlaeota bacterium]|nr:DUF4912 domain-containing protein [Candidatus Sumerlaeota bacterium]HPS02160.1 DUF4912 domain-containing protein [Candidatus Sumerlaeota bacterium]